MTIMKTIPFAIVMFIMAVAIVSPSAFAGHLDDGPFIRKVTTSTGDTAYYISYLDGNDEDCLAIGRLDNAQQEIRVTDVCSARINVRSKNLAACIADRQIFNGDGKRMPFPEAYERCNRAVHTYVIVLRGENEMESSAEQYEVVEEESKAKRLLEEWLVANSGLLISNSD